MTTTANLLTTCAGRPIAEGPPGEPVRPDPHDLTTRIHGALVMLVASLLMAAAMVTAPLMALPPLLLAGWFLGEAVLQRARRRLRYEFDAQGVTRVRGRRRTGLAWERLAGMVLKFRPHKRGAAHGEFVLLLKGAGRRFRVNSTMHRFSALLDEAARAARRSDLRLDATTLSNLRMLGLWGRD